MKLDEHQLAIVREGYQGTEPSVRVEACPGSGKTETMAALISLMAEKGPVIATTFTRDAGRNFSQRLAKYGASGANVQVGTLHSLAGKWIGLDSASYQQHCIDLASGWDPNGLPSGHRIWSRITGFGLIPWTNKKALNLAKSKKQIDINEYALCYAWMRAHGYHTPAIKGVTHFADVMGGSPTRMLEAWQMFEEVKAVVKGFDFFDVIVGATNAIQSGRIKVEAASIVVDEGQDTSPTQWALVDTLQKKADARLFVIGDKDQSVYGWRGATREQFTGMDARVYSLPTNYRSGTKIISLANMLMGRSMKPRPDAPPGVVERLNRPIATRMEELHAEGHAWKDMALISRTNFALAAFEAILKRAGIPALRTGGSFFKLKPVRTFLGYAMMHGQIRSPEVLKSTYRVPNRYLRRAWVDAALVMSAEHNMPLREAAEHAAQHHLKSYERGRNLTPYLRLWDRLVDADWHDACGIIMGQLTQEFEETPNYLEALESIYATARSHGSAAQLMDTVHQLERQHEENSKRPDVDAVRLLTFHGAKGLEWPVVFVDADEDKMPHPRSWSQEEEKRLLYVGITRAKSRLILVNMSMCTPFLTDEIRDVFDI